MNYHPLHLKIERVQMFLGSVVPGGRQPGWERQCGNTSSRRGAAEQRAEVLKPGLQENSLTWGVEWRGSLSNAAQKGLRGCELLKERATKTRDEVETGYCWWRTLWGSCAAQDFCWCKPEQAVSRSCGPRVNFVYLLGFQRVLYPDPVISEHAVSSCCGSKACCIWTQVFQSMLFQRWLRTCKQKPHIPHHQLKRWAPRSLLHNNGRPEYNRTDERPLGFRFPYWLFCWKEFPLMNYKFIWAFQLRTFHPNTCQCQLTP